MQVISEVISVLVCVIDCYGRCCALLFSYAEYMLVRDVSNVIKLPDTLPLDVAAILPCGALAAYAAVQRVHPFVEDRLRNSSG